MEWCGRFILFISICLLNRPLPSGFGKRVRAMQSSLSSSKMPKVLTYDRDTICLPKTLAESGKIAIPRKQQVRSMLASNGLIGKISLKSSMTEKELRREIRSVFRKPMNFNKHFVFDILQPAGGNSKALAIPSVSPSYKWTASAVAGKNAKMPIYIMAQDDLTVCSA